jgi:glutaredoxin 3
MASVIVYGREDCAYSDAAKALLRRWGFDFEDIDIDLEPGKRQEMISRSGGASTTPQTFIDGDHIGGFEDLKRMAERGLLEGLDSDSPG